ncbi:MAG: cytochrome c family protein [Betaproteobacteria bacterium]|nr:cytochrome c family protein [Betaproteobacteria bacterium]
MRKNHPNSVSLMALTCLPAVISEAAMADGDPKRGSRVFQQQCAACHSLERGRHMTGPSLADVWGRKAGTAEGFGRYSEALKKNPGVVWNQPSLDAWLQSPNAFIRGNQMTFGGIGDPQARSDLIAYLKTVSEGREPSAEQSGMMAPGEMVKLKEIGPNAQVKAIRYCGDAYHVTTVAGKTYAFWEFNLRFKTDSGANGPPRGKPVLVSGGMMGDRAFIVFAHPEEIGASIKSRC